MCLLLLVNGLCLLLGLFLRAGMRSCADKATAERLMPCCGWRPGGRLQSHGRPRPGHVDLPGPLHRPVCSHWWGHAPLHLRSPSPLCSNGPCAVRRMCCKCPTRSMPSRWFESSLAWCEAADPGVLPQAGASGYLPSSRARCCSSSTPSLCGWCAI